MSNVWSGREELSEIEKRAIEEHIEQILKEKNEISFADIFKELWHGYYLMNHYMRIQLIVEKLDEECKLNISSDNQISITNMTILNEKGLKEIPVWDYYKKIADIKHKLEIIRIYAEINPLA